jgi:hypothetical protein
MNTNYNNNVEGALKLITINGKVYQLGKDASATEGGIAKLYNEIGTHTDGAMTQAAVKAAVESAAGDASQVASDLAAYQTSNDAAVAANATAISNEASRAAGAEDAINAKIGTVAAGKTVVEMIADAQDAATYDDTALAARVSANEGDLTTLKAGASTEGSVAYQIAQVVAGADASFDTLKEIADWIMSDTTGAAKMASDINSLSSSKADKVASATSGNFAGLDANGNLTDSGKKAADFATAAQGGKADSAIQTVKVNGTALTPDANKAVNVEFEIPERVTAADLATFVV